MASLPRSQYFRRPRADGGPFLVLEDSASDRRGVNIFYTEIPADQRTAEYPRTLLMLATEDELTIFPTKVGFSDPAHFEAKYDTLKSIVVARPVPQPYTLPSSAEQVEYLLEELPAGFSRYFQDGLGLKYEYKYIVDAIGALPGIETLVIEGGGNSRLIEADAPFFTLGIAAYHDLRKELGRISARHQNAGRREKRLLAYHSLLHKLDPIAFPLKASSVPADTIAAIAHHRQGHIKLSSRDRSAAVRLVRSNLNELAAKEPNTLLTLRSDIELVTLKELMQRYEAMLGKQLSESKWQSFFVENPFILSLAFAVPMMMIQGQPYVGGKRVNGQGGKYGDFLFSSVSTGNLAVVEIKKADTELVTKKPYRGDDVYGPSAELTGAVAQVLSQRQSLQEELPHLRNKDRNLNAENFGIRCIVIAGTTPEDLNQKKSFELFRSALADIAIVTFDELAARLAEIYKALAPPSPDNDAPF